MTDDEASQTTTDHETIREWAEERGGRPARVEGTGDGDGGLLRIDFGDQDDDLEELSWDEFFDEFEDSDLALVYEEDSRFSKLVNRDAA
ncbi:hypothetical protein [Halovivax limisalsi]|uniref:hypothetical protein n=1 Tax=Halovivax limisalsi TaxID=1453760 RepID=UPI001FFDB655|nr:hypothetical protein [Halovivax limisalsi]